MYKCPICKHQRNSKHHSDKCSKIAKETPEPTVTAPKTDWGSEVLKNKCRNARVLNRF